MAYNHAPHARRFGHRSYGSGLDVDVHAFLEETGRLHAGVKIV